MCTGTGKQYDLMKDDVSATIHIALQERTTGGFVRLQELLGMLLVARLVIVRDCPPPGPSKHF